MSIPPFVSRETMEPIETDGNIALAEYIQALWHKHGHPNVRVMVEARKCVVPKYETVDGLFIVSGTQTVTSMEIVSNLVGGLPPRGL